MSDVWLGVSCQVLPDFCEAVASGFDSEHDVVSSCRKCEPFVTVSPVDRNQKRRKVAESRDAKNGRKGYSGIVGAEGLDFREIDRRSIRITLESDPFQE